LPTRPKPKTEHLPIIGSSHPDTFIKPKPIIQRLEFSQEDQEEIDAQIEGMPTPKALKYWQRAGHNIGHRKKWYRAPPLQHRLRTLSQKYHVGMCHICRVKFPSVKVMYKLPDITLVEWYCSEDLPSELT